MTASIIDGKAIAAKLSEKTAEAVKRLTAEHGIEPGLAVVLVGDNPASEIYVRSKTAKTAATNMRSLLYKLPASAKAEELFELIDKVSENRLVGLDQCLSRYLSIRQSHGTTSTASRWRLSRRQAGRRRPGRPG